MTAAPTPLGRRIAERIRRAGPMSVADYMALALTDAEHGYYASRDPFGAAGDFVTAPEVSQVFGELLGLWCGVVWQSMGSPDPVLLVELGPGRGTLMADALSAVHQALPAFAAAATVVFVETSPVLRTRQAAALGERHPPARTLWRSDLAAIPPGPALIVANEFFDALPVHQYVRQPDGWAERCIDLAAGDSRLALVEVPMSGPPPGLTSRLSDAPVGSVVETAPARGRAMQQIADRVVAAGGAALIVDYGPFESGVGDTLQAVRRHRFRDILDRPGETDLTSHVDFESLAGEAAAAGASVYGPLAQGVLLDRLGARQRLERLARGRPPAVASRLVAGVRRLTDPRAMGLLFKALAVAESRLPPPPGFDRPPADHGKTGG